MNFMLLVAVAALTREILLLPLEHKIHIFSPPCNILYFHSPFPALPQAYTNQHE